MLNLAQPTDPGWVQRALADLNEVLIDHAHCEKKAAGAAINLLFRYPQHPFLQSPLSALAREELGWTAALGLEDMVRDTWGWQSGNPDGYG